MDPSDTRNTQFADTRTSGESAVLHRMVEAAEQHASHWEAECERLRAAFDQLRILVLALADARTPSEHDRNYEACAAIIAGALGGANDE